jgi:basic membrane lipoprotein Med (substrate-binding protein (PBP1-ABC) superfamily)
MAKAGYDQWSQRSVYDDATKIVSKEYPDTKFAASFSRQCGRRNIRQHLGQRFNGEARFTYAAIWPKNDKTTASVHIAPRSPLQRGRQRLHRGVKAANPDATVDFAFVGSYEDPAKAKEFANAMIANGCDVLQTNSGASNAGVVEAAKDAGVLATGEITDFYDTYNGFYGVIGIGFGDTVYTAIEDLVNGQFPGGEHGVRGLKNGGYAMHWDTYERFARPIRNTPGAFRRITEANELERSRRGVFGRRFDSRFRTGTHQGIKANKYYTSVCAVFPGALKERPGKTIPKRKGFLWIRRISTKLRRPERKRRRLSSAA